MNWVTVIWSMTASACLTLAGIHLLVWCQRRASRDELLFTLTSATAALFAGCELWMMRAETPAQFAALLRWAYVPAWVFLLSLVGFIRLHLRAGRPWLAWTICGLWTLSLSLNFLVGQNLSYREVTRLRHIPFLGESVCIAEGVPNPCLIVAHLSLVLLVIYSADAAHTVWRRGDRRLALVTGGSILLFALTSTLQAVLVLWQMVDWPLTASFFTLGIVVAIGYEMSLEPIRATQLSDDLHESEARMTLAADAAGFGIWMWTIATNRVWGSERWFRLFGFAPAADVGYEEVFQRIYPDDRARVESAVRHALETGADLVSEYRVMLPDGTQRWVAARGRTRPAARGKLTRMLGATIDVTDRKQSELEIAQQRTELAHLSRVTTMSELSGSLAHELNQPLAIILTNAQAAQRLLAQQPPDLAEARDILADIVSEDQRAGEVIRRLRALLKPGQTHLLLLSVNEVIEDVLRIARSDLIGRGITVHTKLDGSSPQALGDRIQLQQVLLNLILNSGDAMAANPPAHRHLTLATSHRDGRVTISVSDNGCGLPPDAERIFDPFYTTKKDGLGLGLPICRSIAASHHGRLWAEANVAADYPPAAPNAGRGTTLHLELPVH